MHITVLTLFPDMFVGPFSNSIIKHAQTKGLVSINFTNIRDFGIGNHQVVDDTAYGGGVGMVMRVDVIHKAIESVRKPNLEKEKERVVLMTADGSTYKQTTAKRYSALDHLILICGHYEGVDERVKAYIDEEVSIGDFVLTGGEIPAMAIIDSVVRLLPGVLPEGATESESYSLRDNQNNPLLEFPTYTRPHEYEGKKVPDVLISGNHAEINKWKQQQAEEKTKKHRPDLLDN